MRGRTGPQDRGTTASAVRWLDKRNAYVLDHPLLVTMATTAMLGGLLCAADPGILASSALSALPGGTERLWAVLLATAGIILLESLRRFDKRIEVLGLMLGAGTFLSYGYAIIAVRGWPPGIAAAPLWLGIGAGFLARAYVLSHRPSYSPWRRRRPRS